MKKEKKEVEKKTSKLAIASFVFKYYKFVNDYFAAYCVFNSCYGLDFGI